MRKLTSLFALIGLFAIAGCDDDSSSTTASSSSSSSSIVGSWGMNETVTENGATYTVAATTTFAEPSKMTVNMKMTMSGVTAMDTTMVGTWKTSGSQLITSIGGGTDTAVYSIAGNKLTVIDTDVEEGETIRDTTVWTRK